MRNITTVGIDIAKNVFQLHGVDKQGNVVLKKRISRQKLLEFVANLSRCLIGIEACGGSHYWYRCTSRNTPFTQSIAVFIGKCRK